MSNSATERPQFNGIPLFSPRDNVGFYCDNTGGTFFGQEYPVIDCGSARLEGFNTGEEDYTDVALAIVNNKLVKGTSGRFESKGFYQLYVHLRFARDFNLKTVKAQILLPENSPLEARLNPEDTDLFHPMEVFKEKEPGFDAEAALFTAYKYKARGIKKEIPYYVPGDPSFLSTLRFAFSFGLKVPRNRQDRLT